MVQKLYGVYDKTIGVHTPFFTNHDVQAKRMFAEMCKDDNSFIGKNPGEYDLYYLGELDEVGGVVVCERRFLAAGALTPLPDGE